MQVVSVAAQVRGDVRELEQVARTALEGKPWVVHVEGAADQTETGSRSGVVGLTVVVRLWGSRLQYRKGAEILICEALNVVGLEVSIGHIKLLKDSEPPAKTTQWGSLFGLAVLAVLVPPHLPNIWGSIIVVIFASMIPIWVRWFCAGSDPGIRKWKMAAIWASAFPLFIVSRNGRNPAHFLDGAIGDVNWHHYLLTTPGGIVPFSLGVAIMVVKAYSRRPVEDSVLTWVAPLVFAAAVGALASIESGMHSVILDRLDIKIQDVEISGADRLHAWSELLSTAVFNTLFPVCVVALGRYWYARWVLRRPWMMRVAALFAIFLAPVFSYVLIQPYAESYPKYFEEQMEKREPVKEFYGLKPEWVCVLPARVGEGDGPYGEGPRMKLPREYVSFGSKGGMVILWDAKENKPVKVSEKEVWVEPWESRGGKCANPN